MKIYKERVSRPAGDRSDPTALEGSDHRRHGSDHGVTETQFTVTIVPKRKYLGDPIFPSPDDNSVAQSGRYLEH